MTTSTETYCMNCEEDLDVFDGLPFCAECRKAPEFTELTGLGPYDRRAGNIILVNGSARVCGACGLAEPDAPCQCTEAAQHNWSY